MARFSRICLLTLLLSLPVLASADPAEPGAGSSPASEPSETDGDEMIDFLIQFGSPPFLVRCHAEPSGSGALLPVAGARSFRLDAATDDTRQGLLDFWRGCREVGGASLSTTWDLNTTE